MNFEEYEKMSRYEAGNWWWEGKGRLITRELKGIGKNPLRILDVGCGTGSNLKRWKNYGEVHGLDFSCDAINFCKIKGNEMLSRGDAASLPFADSSFDTIIALDILEHIEEDTRTLKEFYRVCRKGGLLLLTVPALMLLWSKHDVALNHKRRYAKKQLERMIISSGFEIQKITFWNFTLLIPAAFYRLFGRLKSPGEVRSDKMKYPKLIDALFKGILKIENYLIFKGVTFPCGITIYAICKKV